MTHGIFIHREDSIYRDTPAVRYHFPKPYLERARSCVGDWIVYYEPVKVRDSRGYWAVARVASIVSDPDETGMFYAMMEEGSFLQFSKQVPFFENGSPIERGLLNEGGKISGRAQAAIRPLSTDDFVRIFDAGLPDEVDLLPRTGFPPPLLNDTRMPFEFGERERILQLSARPLRDRAFRRSVLSAYGERCALTGLKLINGGGRAEVEAAHIQSVDANGPDLVANGLALSGTIHWMFDRGLISLADDLKILVSSHVNDLDGIDALLNKDRYARPPMRPADRPHPQFLAWHRESCFKV